MRLKELFLQRTTQSGETLIRKFSLRFFCNLLYNTAQFIPMFRVLWLVNTYTSPGGHIKSPEDVYKLKDTKRCI